MIKINKFHKSYNALDAVKGITFSVEKGELFGLIGPDGAGKTTLIRAICTLLVPDEGEILVAGLDVTKQIPEIRAILGYMPQRFSLYPDLTVEQNLRFFANLFQVPQSERDDRLKQLYKFSRLEPFKTRTAANLSGGMKQKLALSCALIHTPEILVLDEPTFGVDPVSRKEFWEILHLIQQEGTTILVSTAYMDEAEQCDRVALVYKGEIVGLNTPDNLKSLYPYPIYKILGTDLFQTESFFKNENLVHSTQMFGDALHVSFSSEPQKEDWKNWKNQAGENMQTWGKTSPSIEDVFLESMVEEN
jgi:ABC-2 type transport system ATP-binding protein